MKIHDLNSKDNFKKKTIQGVIYTQQHGGYETKEMNWYFKEKNPKVVTTVSIIKTTSFLCVETILKNKNWAGELGPHSTFRSSWLGFAFVLKRNKRKEQ